MDFNTTATISKLLKAAPEDALYVLAEAESGTPDQKCIAGRYCIQRARLDAGSDSGLVWLERGEAGLRKAVEDDKRDGYGFGGASARSMAELANMSILTELVGGSATPSIESVAKAYSESIEVGSLICEWSDYYLDIDRSHKDLDVSYFIRELSGCISEIAVLVLLNRYATLSISDGTWFGLPSMLREDFHIDGNYCGSGNWDIGVYSQTSSQNPAELSYKIQVKNKSLRKITAYDDDISIVSLFPDLRVGREKGGLIGAKIIAECVDELDAKGEHWLSTRIDERTDSLLEILG